MFADKFSFLPQIILSLAYVLNYIDLNLFFICNVASNFEYFVHA